MRIYIDCSHVDFSRQPTGIPRVVLKYIEEGYRWATRTGIEVVPVLTGRIGLVPVIPAPGSDTPSYLEGLSSIASHAIDSCEVDAHVNSAAFHLQAAMKEAGLAPLPEECARVTRSMLTDLIEKSLLDSGPGLAVEPGDILFCPAYWHDVPPRNYRALQALGVRIVTLVHDILPVSYSKFYPAPWKYEFEENLVTAIKYSDQIYAVSAYTANSIVEFAARKSLRNIAVGVSYNGFDALVGEEFKRRIDDPSFQPLVSRRSEYTLLRELQPYLMVGTLEPKKGHIPTIRSFEAMWNAGLERPLVVIGRKGWIERTVIEAIERSPYYLDRLFWFDDFDDFDLYFAYHHCRGLIFSSYAEGFGIPMIEALSSGRPVIALDTPISREVLGEWGRFFASFAELAEQVSELEDETQFQVRLSTLEDFKWPAWQEIVTTLFDRIVEI